MKNDLTTEKNIAYNKNIHVFVGKIQLSERKCENDAKWQVNRFSAKTQHREDESGVNFVGRNNPGQAG